MANDKDFILKNAVEVGGSTKVTVGDAPSSGTFDLATGNYFATTPSASVQYDFSNAGDTQTFQLEVTPSATITITWDADIQWAGGTAPDSPANGEKDLYTITTDDGGITYVGNQSGDNFS